MANIFRTSGINRRTPKTTNRFSLRFVGLTEVMGRAENLPGTATNPNRFNRLKAAWTGTTNDKITDALELSLASVTVPAVEIEIADVYRFNDSVKHITRFAPMQDLTISFYDYVTGSASAIMQTWHGLVGDKSTGAISFKNQYICQAARLYEYGPMTPSPETNYEKSPASGPDESPISVYEIRNVYPRQIELGDFTYETADVRKITVQFACDGIYPISFRYESRDNV
jgi:hypothetical protein